MQKIARYWSHFWFDADYAINMRAFRIAFATVLVVTHAALLPELEMFYGESGIFPLQIFSSRQFFAKPPFIVSLVQEYLPDGFWPFGPYFLLLASLTTLLFGIFPRISALTALMLSQAFINYQNFTAYGIDQIALTFLIFFCFADYRSPGSSLGSVIFRLCQIHLCAIYWAGGTEKFFFPQWREGEAIWYSLAHTADSGAVFVWLAHWPVLISSLTYTSALGEAVFPIAIWFQRYRFWALAFGVSFHFGIAIFMKLSLFSALMISTYFLFIPPEFLMKSQKLRKRS